jgi:hypothetical protein
VWDLGRAWVREIDPSKFGYLLGNQDQVIYMSLNAGMAPHEVGRYAAWPGFIGTSKMIVPVGIVNACNPRQAALDARELGRLKDVEGRPNNYALDVAAAIAAGVAEGLKPGASPQSVMDVAMAELSEPARREVQQGLDWAKETGDWKALRPIYAEKYEGRPISNAVEMLSSAIAVFSLTGADPKEAILRCVNFGRDTDCRSYICSAFAAALAGPSTIPQEWIDTIEDELKDDPYTVSRRSLRESSDGLYLAAMKELERAREHVRLWEAAL